MSILERFQLANGCWWNGTSTLVGQEARYVWLAVKSIGSTLAVQRVGRGVLNREVGRIIRWGYLVQQRGYPVLESEVKKVERDEFLRFGVELS